MIAIQKDSLLRESINETTKATTKWLHRYALDNNCPKLVALLKYAFASTNPASDRAFMVRLGCELMGKDWHIALPGMASFELKNMSLLVTDDFFDNRQSLRLGKVPIYRKWGSETCVALGFILKSLASEALIDKSTKSAGWDCSKAIEILEWATKRQYYSQILENELIKKPISKITQDMYMELIENATSVGIAGAFELGCLIGGGTDKQRKKFSFFGLNLGHLLQIRDDLIDYIYSESLIKKGAFNDLFSKKRRLPLLTAYWQGNNSEKNKIEGILEKKKIDLEDALDIIDLITSEKVEKRIKAISASIALIAKRELISLPNIGPTKDILFELVELFTDL